MRMVSQARKHDLVCWNQTDPAATAVIVEGQFVRFGTFRQDVERIQRWLSLHGIIQNQRVGIFVKHEYWNWVVHLAAWQNGSTIVSLREPDGKHTVSALAIDKVICGRQYADNYSHSSVLIFDDAIQHDILIENPFSDSDEACGAIRAPQRMVLTSGTTGKARCVSWTAEITLARIEQIQQGLGLNQYTRLYSFQDIGTTGGFRYPIACWRSGGAVLLRGSDFGISSTLRAARESNLLTLAPANLQVLASAEPEPWPGIDERHVVVAGGRMGKKIFEITLKTIAKKVTVAYGATETGSVATGDANLIYRHPGAAGFVRDGVTVEVVGMNNQPLPPESPGLLRVKTPYMVNGYEVLPLEAGSSECPFRDTWFYPGDEGILSTDGFLAILGRSGDVVNVAGAKISLPNLEQQIESLSCVDDVCVVLLELPECEKLGVVVVTNKGNVDPELHRTIKRNISPRIPYILIHSRKIDRNEMGKVPRKLFAKKLAAVLIERAPHVLE